MADFQNLCWISLSKWMRAFDASNHTLQFNRPNPINLAIYCSMKGTLKTGRDILRLRFGIAQMLGLRVSRRKETSLIGFGFAKPTRHYQFRCGKANARKRLWVKLCPHNYGRHDLRELTWRTRSISNKVWFNRWNYATFVLSRTIDPKKCSFDDIALLITNYASFSMVSVWSVKVAVC